MVHAAGDRISIGGVLALQLVDALDAGLAVYGFCLLALAVALNTAGSSSATALRCGPRDREHERHLSRQASLPPSRTADSPMTSRCCAGEVGLVSAGLSEAAPMVHLVFASAIVLGVFLEGSTSSVPTSSAPAREHSTRTEPRASPCKAPSCSSSSPHSSPGYPGSTCCSRSWSRSSASFKRASQAPTNG